MYPTNFVILPRPRWVETAAEAEEVIRYLSENMQNPVAVDTETTGLDRFRERITVWSLSDGRRRYVIRAELLPLFESFFQMHPHIVFHNANFDTAILLANGIDMKLENQLGRRIDTMVMHHWIDQNVPHSLEWIAYNELGMWKISYVETFGKDKNNKAGIIDVDLLSDESYKAKVAEYASLDAYLTYLAYLQLDMKLRNIGMADSYYGVETCFQDSVFFMERSGIRVDVDRLSDFVPLYEARLREIETEFNRQAGKPFNLRSPMQLRDFFYKTRDKAVDKLTASGSNSTDVSVLTKWAKEGDPFAKMLLEYRNLDQQYKTYVKGMLERVDSSGRVHTTYKLEVADTGRLSSVDPNLQNIVNDKKIPEAFLKSGVSFRKIFVPDSGCLFWDYDYNQLEMCIGAHYSKDKDLVATIRNGKDLHSMTAAAINGLEYDQVFAAKKKADAHGSLTPEEKKMVNLRSAAKTVGFGVFYGMGANRLSEQVGCSKEEAQQYIDRFFTQYPGVQAYVDQMKTDVRTKGFVTTLLGRRRVIDGARNLSRKVRGTAERAAVNAPIQGSAADVLRLAMKELAMDRTLREAGWKMLLQVHDELLFQGPEDSDPQVSKHIEEVMANPGGLELLVPLTASGQCGKNWGEAK
jgi:DNA polymerase I